MQGYSLGKGEKLILTEEGRKVLSYAKTIFDIGQEMKDRMVDLTQEGRTHLHIGISNYVPKTIVEFLLTFILKNEPDIHIALTKDKMDKLTRDLEDHLLDLVLTDTPFESPLSGNINNKFIGKIPVVFCAHPKLAKKIKRFPKDMNGQPIILPAAPRQITHTLKEFLYEHQIETKIVGEIQDVEIVRRLALRGYGIAALNQLTIQEAPAKQKLIILGNNSKNTIYEKVYIITKKRKETLPIVENIFKEIQIR